MQVKTYRAPTLKAALEEIKRELGPDAFIVGQKEVHPKHLFGRKRTCVEVTAAIDHSNTSFPKAAVPKAIEKTEDLNISVEDRIEITAQPSQPDVLDASTAENGPLLDEIRKLKAMVHSIMSQRS